MKPKFEPLASDSNSVAPLAGAWIETQGWEQGTLKKYLVAPLAGAWIETQKTE